MLAMLIIACNKSEQLVGTVGTPINIGLNTLWSDHNLGATDDTDAGVLSSFNTKGRKNKYIDPAKNMWHGNWKVPTKEQAAELIDKCKWEYQHGKNPGFKVTGPNGKSIFFRTKSDREPMDYWISDKAYHNSSLALFLYFTETYADTSFSEMVNRKFIRPVMDNNSHTQSITNTMSGDKSLSGNVTKNIINNGDVLELDTARTIDFNLCNVNNLTFIKCSGINISEGSLCMTDTTSQVCMKIHGLLAFTIDVETNDNNAYLYIRYNKGKDYITKKMYIRADNEQTTDVMYANKNDTTTIAISSASKLIKIKRINMFHSIKINM